jgi:hypothetical protein
LMKKKWIKVRHILRFYLCNKYWFSFIVDFIKFNTWDYKKNIAKFYFSAKCVIVGMEIKVYWFWSTHPGQVTCSTSCRLTLGFFPQQEIYFLP